MCINSADGDGYGFPVDVTLNSILRMVLLFMGDCSWQRFGESICYSQVTILSGVEYASSIVISESKIPMVIITIGPSCGYK